MNCPFCKINNIKTRIIRQGKHYFIALSNPRLVPGHLLVIPKRHIEKASQLNSQERKEIFDAIIALEEEILKKFASGCDIKTHYRPFINESNIKVNHLHFHLQPREFEDELYRKSQIGEKKLWKELPKEEKGKFTKLFKK